MESEVLNIEWQDLRTEIFELDKACLAILQVTIAITATLIGWYSSTTNPEPIMIVVLSPIWFFAYTYLYQKRRSIRRIEGDLRNNVETKPNTPNWQTRLHEFRKQDRYPTILNPERTEFFVSVSVQIGIAYVTRFELHGIRQFVSLPIILIFLTCFLFLYLRLFDKSADEVWRKVEKELLKSDANAQESEPDIEGIETKA